MKLLFVANDLHSGGQERQLVELVKGLTERNKYDITLYMLQNRVHYDEIFKMNLSLLANSSNPKNKISIMINLNKIIKEIEPDILISWGPIPNFYTTFYKAKYKYKLINVFIRNCNPPKKFTVRWFSKILSFKYSDIVIGNSLTGNQLYNVPNSKSICIYNGFDFSRLNRVNENENIKKILNIDDDSFIIGMVASFWKTKDYTTFCEVARYFEKLKRNIKFIAVGGGPDFLKFYNQYNDLDNLCFTGNVKNVEKYINIMDIGVLCTFSEGISNTLMEYMAMKKCIIVSEGGATHELIDDGYTGFIIKQGSVQVLVSKIYTIYKDKQLQKNMGEHAYLKLYSKFGLQSMVDNYTEVIDRYDIK